MLPIYFFFVSPMTVLTSDCRRALVPFADDLVISEIGTNLVYLQSVRDGDRATCVIDDIKVRVSSFCFFFAGSSSVE
jgi:hypothetical protein